MTEMTQDEVRTALTPYHSRIRLVVERGYKEWKTVDAFRKTADFGSMLYDRSVANYVFDAIARNAQALFSGDKTIRVRPETQTIKFIFGGKVIARFKKADDGNMGSNVPTQAIMDYLDPQQMLPGFPAAAAKVEIVWAANDIGTEIAKITVVARRGNTMLWSYHIDDDAGDDTGVLQFPLTPAPDEFSPLVVVRPGKKQTES